MSERTSRPDESSEAPPPSKPWVADLLASLVVFLVALPLCIGIAVACGVPAERGLITGIVGGIIVGTITGAPLLVSGPAASLIVPVFSVVQSHGIAALAPVVMLAGVWQGIAGAFGIGQWFRAVAPAVIHGMLIGIGILIFASQLHVAIDSDPESSFVENVGLFPGALIERLHSAPGGLAAVCVGAGTIAILVLWNRYRPKKLHLVPGHLVSLLLVMLATLLLSLPVRFLDMSPNFLGALVVPSLSTFKVLLDPSILGLSLMFAFVASAATLLTASAIDQRQSRSQTNYNREMVAQGIGNVVTGSLGGLPMTGVIVRSSVNVDAGAQTRMSTILHGIWILGFVLIAPQVLEKIPRAALGAILVYTGYKLIDYRAIVALYRRGRSELAICLITLFGVVFVELFIGIVAGLAAAIFKLVYTFSHLEIRSDASPSGAIHHLHLSGSATFVRLPQLAESLESVPKDRELHVHIDRLDHIDHACLELLSNWKRRRDAEGAPGMVVEWDELTSRYQKALLGAHRREDEPSRSLLRLVWGEWKRIYGPQSETREDTRVRSDWIDASRIAVRVQAEGLDDVLHRAAGLLAPRAGRPAADIQTELRRRADRHIVLGEGVSIPHAPMTGLHRPMAACIVTTEPVDVFGETADVFFVLLAPESDPRLHLHSLAHVGGLCQKADLLAGLREAATADEAADLLHTAGSALGALGAGAEETGRLAVLEVEGEADARQVARNLTAAFLQPALLSSEARAPFETILRFIGAPDSRHLLLLPLQERDVSVLRALLAEQSRLFPALFCRLHVLKHDVLGSGAGKQHGPGLRLPTSDAPQPPSSPGAGT